MKKLTLLLSFITVTTFGQFQYPIAPGCEKLTQKNELLQCFNTYTTELITIFLQLSNNINLYFRIQDFQEIVNFKLGIQGQYIYKITDSNSEVINKIAPDIFNFINNYQKESNQFVIPTKSNDGRPVILSFNLPLNFIQKVKFKTDVDKHPILFTINNGEYLVRLGKNITFMIYNKNNEPVRIINSIKDLYSDELLRPLILEKKNTIVEKNINGKKIKLEVYNLFKNQSEPFKISYFENDKLIKEFSSMDKFLNSNYSEYIY